MEAHQGMMKSDNGTTFRLIYYPPLGEEPLPGSTRCGEHTDYGTFTLLAQDSEGGLEVRKLGVTAYFYIINYALLSDYNGYSDLIYF